jgi:hypothetical protein
VGCSPETTAPPTPDVSSSTLLDTSTWKTYRNEKYGFEFRYPPTINGYPTNNYSGGENFKILDVSFPFGGPYKGKGDTLIYSALHSVLTFNVKEMGNQVVWGVDLGGMGGYIYDVSQEKWFLREIGGQKGKEISEAEAFKYAEKIEMPSGGTAYSISWSAYEEAADGYHIFDKRHRLYLKFMNSYSSADVGIYSAVKSRKNGQFYPQIGRT